ncbi:MAG TPA: RNA polymerase sigma factor [Candidatus Saccharimonadia bacterium]|nr:RNA polymerase sigma factor [Candidatus Saccharimonadia bacterium]
MPDANPFYEPLDAMTLGRAQRGEAAAFAEIYRRYRGACFNLALRVLGDVAGAEDVVQEVFVRLFDSIRRFRGDAPFGAWLRRSVANATVDELRRRNWLTSDDGARSEAAPSPGGLAEDQVEAWQMLMRLPARARAVVVLHALEGYTHAELGSMLGQSESYSKSVLARALHRLSLVVAPQTAGEVDAR